ncbi:putative inorganic phosphate cotransporter [Condylostylus longicornis]|uniref:putative inorganic phosphate cotransporter n=1 Tax=Condylostylus longicornis TaxID=2530218 RepID=UPI00244DF72A|nr:putative inorganic phosphate cotransporter [Condylostylus longicornis]
MQMETQMDKKSGVLGIRHFQCVLLFFALIFGYFLRVNMSTAIVAMTDLDINPNIEHFNYTQNEKQLILSSFFWGYAVAQVPSGVMASFWGGKTVLAFGTILCSIFTAILPLLAKYGIKIVIFLRVLAGLTQGVVYPCVHTLLSKWVPSTERSFLGTTVYSGAQLGTVIMLASSGALTESTIGWHSIFYLSAAISFIWSIFFLIFGAERPVSAKFISNKEREYIEMYTAVSKDANTSKHVPWIQILLSPPFVGLLLAHCGFTWGFYTLLTEIPMYLHHVLELDISQNALLSALPYLTMWILCLVFSPFADFLINHQYISVEFSRKLFNSVGQWIPMICLIGLSFMTKETTSWAIILLTLAVGFNAAQFCGYLVNHMDLSPNYAGQMMGITNGVSNLLSIAAPLVVGAVVTEENDTSQWQIIFFITSGVYLVCNMAFLLLGKSEIQKFNHYYSKNESLQQKK